MNDCKDAADVNDDGKLDLSDPVSILGFLFLGGSPPVLGTECVRIAGCPESCRQARRAEVLKYPATPSLPR